jgi:hypothetical protein
MWLAPWLLNCVLPCQLIQKATQAGSQHRSAICSICICMRCGWQAVPAVDKFCQLLL